MELWTAFTIGIFGSFHCVGMCGPIALALPLDRKSKIGSGIRILLYNVGRITTYAIIGLIPGLIGMSLSIAGFQKTLSIVLGILFVAGALFTFAFLKKWVNFTFLPQINQWVEKYLGIFLKSNNSVHFYIVGFINGFLPCGLVYVALAGALTQGSVFLGAQYMIAFGLGTIPLMVFVSLAQGLISVRLRNSIRKAIPLVIFLFGVIFILRGVGIKLPEQLDTWFIMGFMQMCD